GLLDHVGGPAGDAAHHEDGREHGDVETHQVIGGPGREVEVRVDVFLTHHDVLERFVHFQPLCTVAKLCNLLQRAFHGGYTAVALFVHAVSEAHDHFPALEFAAQPVSGPGRVVNLQHRVHDRFVRAAVQRTLECADRGRAGAVQISGGGGDDPRGERRGVEAVFGVQHE